MTHLKKYIKFITQQSLVKCRFPAYAIFHFYPVLPIGIFCFLSALVYFMRTKHLMASTAKRSNITAGQTVAPSAMFSLAFD